MKKIIHALSILLLPVFFTAKGYAADITIVGKGSYQLPSKEIRENIIKENGALPLSSYTLLDESTKIKAFSGSAFGIEFVVDDEVSGRIPLTLIIRHPVLDSEEMTQKRIVERVKINPAQNRRYFAGWIFSGTEELKAGKWTIEFEGHPKSAVDFNVTNVEELEYDGSRLSTPEPPQKKRTMQDKPEQLPYGKTLTRYLVQGGVFPTIAIAKEKRAAVRKRGFKPFIFVREHAPGTYSYYLFIKMFDTMEKAEEFAKSYRNTYKRKALPQKISIRLAPMSQ